MMKQKPRPQSHDNTPQMVIVSLSIIAVILCVGILVLVDRGRTPDAALYTLAGGAVTALGTLLTNLRGNGQRSTDGALGTDSNPAVVKAPEGGAVVTEEAK